MLPASPKKNGASSGNGSDAASINQPSSITSFDRSFTLEGTTNSVEYNEHRGPTAPPATLGAVGDIYIHTDSKKPVMYARCAVGWTVWPGPQARNTPLAHPTHPDFCLWASTARAGVFWTLRSGMGKKLLGSAADVLKNILERDSKKRKAGKMLSRPGVAKKPRVSDPVPAEPVVEPSEPSISVPPPPIYYIPAVASSTPAVSATKPPPILVPTSNTAGQSNASVSSASSGIASPTRPIDTVPGPRQVQPSISTPTRKPSASSTRPITPINTISSSPAATRVKPASSATKPSVLDTAPLVTSTEPATLPAKRPAASRDDGARKRPRLPQIDDENVDKTVIREEMRPVREQLKQLKAQDKTNNEKLKPFQKNLAVVGRHIEGLLQKKMGSGEEREKYRRQLWTFASRYSINEEGKTPDWKKLEGFYEKWKPKAKSHVSESVSAGPSTTIPATNAVPKLAKAASASAPVAKFDLPTSKQRQPQPTTSISAPPPRPSSPAADSTHIRVTAQCALPTTKQVHVSSAPKQAPPAAPPSRKMQDRTAAAPVKHKKRAPIVPSAERADRPSNAALSSAAGDVAPRVPTTPVRPPTNAGPRPSAAPSQKETNHGAAGRSVPATPSLDRADRPPPNPAPSSVSDDVAPRVPPTNAGPRRSATLSQRQMNRGPAEASTSVTLNPTLNVAPSATSNPLQAENEILKATVESLSAEITRLKAKREPEIVELVHSVVNEPIDVDAFVSSPVVVKQEKVSVRVPPKTGTQAPKAGRKPEIIDLTLDDSDDEDSASAPRPRPPAASSSSSRLPSASAASTSSIAPATRLPRASVNHPQPQGSKPAIKPANAKVKAFTATPSQPSTSRRDPQSSVNDPGPSYEGLVERSKPGHFRIAGTDFDYSDTSLTEIVPRYGNVGWGGILAQLELTAPTGIVSTPFDQGQWNRTVLALRDYFTLYLAPRESGPSGPERSTESPERRDIIVLDGVPITMSAAATFEQQVGDTGQRATPGRGQQPQAPILSASGPPVVDIANVAPRAASAADRPSLTDPDECKNATLPVKVKKEDVVVLDDASVSHLNQVLLSHFFPRDLHDTVSCAACIIDDELEVKYKPPFRTPKKELWTHMETAHPETLTEILEQTAGMDSEKINKYFLEDQIDAAVDS
ncbi:hypothetical protein C8R43DRAFT_986994 [Mycena crocata]|nr:hypothetical protein C8R43DRAFT_986994 [Mycena crocata]